MRYGIRQGYKSLWRKPNPLFLFSTRGKVQVSLWYRRKCLDLRSSQISPSIKIEFKWRLVSKYLGITPFRDDNAYLAFESSGANSPLTFSMSGSQQLGSKRSSYSILGSAQGCQSNYHLAKVAWRLFAPSHVGRVSKCITILTLAVSTCLFRVLGLSIPQRLKGFSLAPPNKLGGIHAHHNRTPR